MKATGVVLHTSFVRRIGLLAWCAVTLASLLPHCDTTCKQGDPCSESQAGFACLGNDPCTTLICDGVQYGSTPKVAGDPCTTAGATCPTPHPSSGCEAALLVCNGDQLVFTPTETVGPGNTCSTGGLVCPYPGTECQSCTCNGIQWVCETGGCCGCFDAGSCPPPESVIEGEPCQSAIACSSIFACGDASAVSGACTCPAGVWTCAAVVTCDAGSD